MSILQIILTPFAWLLTVFYNLTGSYGIALILFAIVLKIILFYPSLRGKKGMIKTTMLSSEVQAIKKKYGSDQAGYNRAVQELYARENAKPMSGCLWTLIPLIVLMLLYAIIRRPLFYTMGMNADQIAQVASTLNWGQVALENGWIKSAAEFTSSGYNEMFLASLINHDNLAAVQAVSPSAFVLDFRFLGLDLSQIPQLKFWLTAGGFGLFLLPIVSAITGFFSSLIANKTNNLSAQQAQANSANNRMLLLLTPLISLWIGFSMPAALCIYWIANNVLMVLQELLCGRLLKKDYEKAKAERAERDRLAREAEQEERRRKAEERARRLEEEKNNRGKKKKNAKPDEEDEKLLGSVQEASRVGMRTYARGRAYDPNRYGGVTPYVELKVAPPERKGKGGEERAETPAPGEEQPAVTTEAPAEAPAAEVLPDNAVQPEEAPQAEEPYAEEAEPQDESEKTE